MTNKDKIKLNLVEVRETLDMLEFALLRCKDDVELIEIMVKLKAEEKELVSQLSQRSDTK